MNFKEHVSNSLVTHYIRELILSDDEQDEYDKYVALRLEVMKEIDRITDDKDK